jgi:hypothetical protein
MMGVSFGIAVGGRRCENWMSIQAKVSFRKEIHAKVRPAIDTQQLLLFELTVSRNQLFQIVL